MFRRRSAPGTPKQVKPAGEHLPPARCSTLCAGGARLEREKINGAVRNVRE